MAEGFKVGDRVIWNSEAGKVSGTIIRVHTKDVDYKGHTHHASGHEPQYEIKSSITAHPGRAAGMAIAALTASRTVSPASVAVLTTERKAA